MRNSTLWAAAILIVASSALAEQTVNQTRSVAAEAEISIENVAGSVTVIGGDGTQLQVTGTMGDDVEELEISGDADGMSIEVVIPDGNWRGEHKLTADLEIRLPRGAKVEIETVSAWIDVSGVSGEVEASSVSGAVKVKGSSSKVEVESVSGSVSVNGGAGQITAESVSGKVQLDGVSGDVEASTVSGDIRVSAGAVDDVELETVAGGVYFKGELGAGSLEVDSHSGNVEILLPADVSAEFQIESFSGRIDNAFGPPARRTDRHAPGSSTEFRTGMGGAEVSIETFSGNVVLKSF